MRFGAMKSYEQLGRFIAVQLGRFIAGPALREQDAPMWGAQTLAVSPHVTATGVAHVTAPGVGFSSRDGDSDRLLIGDKLPSRLRAGGDAERPRACCLEGEGERRVLAVVKVLP
jgi:hypothetical protein